MEVRPSDRAGIVGRKGLDIKGTLFNRLGRGFDIQSEELAVINGGNYWHAFKKKMSTWSKL